MSADVTGRAFSAGSRASLKTEIAAVAVVLALAGLAAYALFSGPTIVAVPNTSTPKSAPSKVAPPAEDRFPEGREGSRGD